MSRRERFVRGLCDVVRCDGIDDRNIHNSRVCAFVGRCRRLQILKSIFKFTLDISRRLWYCVVLRYKEKARRQYADVAASVR